jgi:hypothetical protein
MENVHSYGYDTKGKSGWVIADVHGDDRPTDDGSTTFDSMSSPDPRAD